MQIEGAELLEAEKQRMNWIWGVRKAESLKRNREGEKAWWKSCESRHEKEKGYFNIFEISIESFLHSEQTFFFFFFFAWSVSSPHLSYSRIYFLLLLTDKSLSLSLQHFPALTSDTINNWSVPLSLQILPILYKYFAFCISNKQNYIYRISC